MLPPSLGSLLSLHSSLLVASLPRLRCQFKFAFLCAFHAAFDFRLNSNRLRWLPPSPFFTPAPLAGSPFGSCLISIIWRVSSSARGLCQGRARQVKTNLTHTHTHSRTHTYSHTHTLRFWQKIVRFSTKFWINHGGDMSSSAAAAARFTLRHATTSFRDSFFPLLSHFISLCRCRSRCLMCRRGREREGESWQLSSWTEITWISKGTYGNELVPSDPTATPSPLSLGSEAEAVATCSFSRDWGTLEKSERERGRERAQCNAKSSSIDWQSTITSIAFCISFLAMKSIS